MTDQLSKPNADADDLAEFGYEQDLDRSFGKFSSFAAGFRAAAAS